MEIILGCIAGIIGLIIIVKLFTLPFKLVWNGVCGMILLWIVNMLGSMIGMHLNITVINALIAGFFGIPGVFCMIAYQLLSK